jgi:hypothetical protein
LVSHPKRLSIREKRVLRKMSEPKGDEVKDAQRNFIMKSFIIQFSSNINRMNILRIVG